MREEALAALSTWAKPSVLDRVDGRYRGVVTRDPSIVKTKTEDILIKLTANKESVIRLNAVKAIGKLKIEKASKNLFTLLKSDPQSEIRSESLKSLAYMNDKQIGDAISQALSDKEKSVRVTGLDLLGKMDISKDLMIKLLNDVIDTRTIEEKQAAITTLGKLPLVNSQPSLEQLLSKMESGKLPRETYLELAEAIDSTRLSQLIARYKAINKKLSPDTLKASYEGSLLGGDPNRGAGIFYGHQAAQCIRCHSLGDYGGTAGPRLNGVAKRLTREQILQALIDPSARIAPGFGTVSLELKDGRKINGILQQEKPNGLLVKIGDKPDTLIANTAIVKRTNGMSSMPLMRYLLTKKEIRDVVSFLATLKEE
jgi:putative heme-binding domain-containing protein